MQITITDTAVLTPALIQQAAQCAAQLHIECADAMQRHELSLDGYISTLEYANPIGSYRNVPAPFRVAFERLVTDEPTRAEAFLRLVTATEIAGSSTRTSCMRLPPSVTNLLREAVQKILRGVVQPRPGYFRHDNEMFAKDLAVARLSYLPCGAEMVDVRSGLERSSLWKYGTHNSPTVARLFMRLGGTRPMLAGHWDRRLAAEFTAAGYRRFYRVVAELLVLNPAYRGLLGTSWWFDPGVGKISPELAFLRQEPLQGGAVFVPAPTPESSVKQALQGAQRALLYERGQYRPQNYLMAWPKRALLQWVARCADG